MKCICINVVVFVGLWVFFLIVGSDVLNEDVQTNDILDLELIESKMLRIETPSLKGWKCLDCEYEHHRKDLVVSHIQANHVTNFPGYSCSICGKFSKTWVALQKHRTRNHKGH